MKFCYFNKKSWELMFLITIFAIPHTLVPNLVLQINLHIA